MLRGGKAQELNQMRSLRRGGSGGGELSREGGGRTARASRMTGNEWTAWS